MYFFFFYVVYTIREQRDNMERIVNRVDAMAEEQSPDLKEHHASYYKHIDIIITIAITITITIAITNIKCYYYY